MTHIGIDNATLEHKIHISGSGANKPRQMTISNDLAGFRKLEEEIRLLEDVKIGFEIPHGPLVDFLSRGRYSLYSLNPLKIKRFKETVAVSGNKSDRIDAEAIAQYLEANETRCRPLLFNSPEIEKLKHLSIIHRRMSKEHSRYLNKLHFAVREYFGLQESLFGTFGCKTQLQLLLMYPTFTDLAKASDRELVDFLKSHKYRNPKLIQRVIDKIRHHEQVVLPEREYAYQLETSFLCGILLSLRDLLYSLELDMERIVSSHRLGTIFKSLPGAGRILSAKLLVLFGDVKARFTTANGVQCLYGTAPKNYQSGGYHRVVMRKACNKAGRDVLYDYSFSSIRFSPWARSYYDLQRSRGKTHSVALRALSNKWVQVIFKMWQSESLYQESMKSKVA